MKFLTMQGISTAFFWILMTLSILAAAFYIKERDPKEKKKIWKAGFNTAVWSLIFGIVYIFSVL